MSLRSPRFRPVAFVAVLALLATLSFGSAGSAEAAVTGITVTGPATAPVNSDMTYIVQLTCDAAGCPATTITVPIPAHTQYRSSSVPGATATATTVTLPVGNLAASSVTEYQVVFRDTDFQQSTYPSPASIAISGVQATSGGTTFTQSGAVTTTITGTHTATTTKVHAEVAGSHNRTVDWTISVAVPDLSNDTGVWALAATRVVDDFPVGATVVISTGWTCTGGPATGTQCIYAGGASGGGGTTLPTLEVTYPSPTFAAGYTPTNTAKVYGMQFGGDPTTFDPSNPTPAGGPWFALPNSNTEIADPVFAGNPATTPGALAAKTLNGGGAVPNGVTVPYVLKSSVTGAAQDSMTVVDDLSGVSDHFLVTELDQTLSPALQAVNPTGVYTFTLSNGSTVTKTEKLSGTRLYIGKSSDTLASPGLSSIVTVPAGTHVTKVTIKYFVDNGSGSPVPNGLPAGSTVTQNIEGVVSYANLSTGATPASAPTLHNCMTETVLPAALTDPTDAISSSCAPDSPVIDGLPVGGVNFAGTVTAGTSPTLSYEMINNEPTRTINGLTSYIVLPPGIFLDTSRPVTAQFPVLSSSVSKTLPDGRQVIAVNFGALPPINNYTAGAPLTLNGSNFAFPVNVPLIVSAAAYNPPASDSAPAPNYTAATPATLATFGNQYLPQRGAAADVYDVNGNGNATEILPEETNAIRVLASGSLIGSELSAASAAGPFSPSTTVPAGSPAVLRQVITNLLPNPTDNVRIYDTLPAAGDAEGSTFTPVLTGPPTGVPAGWTVAYSTSSNPCTAPADPNPAGCTGGYTFAPVSAADFASVKSIRLNGPSLAQNGNATVNYPISVPGTTQNGQVAVDSFVMYGTSNGSAFGPVNTTAARVIASVAANGQIGNLVFDDRNGDGIHQAGEPGLAGVVVTVKNAAGATVYTTTTTASGAYEATGLPAGTYTVTFDASAVANHKPSPTGPGLDNLGAGPITVTLTGDGHGGTTSNNAVDFGATPISKLEIDKTVDAATAAHGDTLTYTVTVKNIGIVDLTNVAANDVLPAGVGYVSATGGGVYTAATSTVHWTIASLPVGATATYTVNAKVDPGTNAELLTNSFGVTTPSWFDPTTVDDPCAADATRSCATTAIGALGALQIDKTVDKARAVRGDTLTYIVTVKNIGSLAATDVSATDALPKGLAYKSSTGGGTLAGSTLSWTIASLAPGQSVSFQVVAVVDTSGTSAESLVNAFGVTNPAGFLPTTVLNACATDAPRSCATTTVADVVAAPLAFTGNDSRFQLLLALLLLAAGGALTLLGRRRATT